MSEEQKKPKDIKDLKSRLGKAAPAAGASVPPGVVPPPSISPPPAGVAPAVTGAGGLPATAVPTPPFAQAAAAAAPVQAAPRPIDPFASAPAAVAAGPREVRIVVDEKPVEDTEIGRSRQRAVIMVAVVGIFVGLILGFGGGSVLKDRRIFNRSVRDGKELYASVETSAQTVDQAKRLIDAAMGKARPTTPGVRPQVDFTSIEGLRALKKPFEASAFSGRNYNTFNPETVNALFEYQTGVTVMWEKMNSIINRTLSQSARTELTAAATAAGEIAGTQFGIVPRSVDNHIVGTLVFVDPPAPSANNQPPTKLSVRASRGGAAGEKTIYNGESLESSPDNFVMLIDGPSSAAVLGQSASAFAEYLRAIAELKALVDSTAEVQGRLITGLGEVSRNQEQFAF